MSEPQDPFELGWPARSLGDAEVASRPSVEDPVSRELRDDDGWGQRPGPPQPDGAPPAAADQTLGAVLAGLLAAIVVGAVWGYVAKLTGREFGVLAWGVGAAVATAIAHVAGRNATNQVIGVTCALIGIVIGK